MSGIRRVEDLYLLKTRNLLIQNQSGSFPDKNNVLVVGDDKGHMKLTANLVVNDVSSNTIEVVDTLRVYNKTITDDLSANTVSIVDELRVYGDTIVDDLSANTVSIVDKLRVYGDTVVDDLSANTVEVDRLITNKIVAATITVGGAGSPAVISNGSDIKVNYANIYVSGDQQNTGYIQASSIALLDPINNNQESYLWVNDNKLQFQDICSNIINISNLAVDLSANIKILVPLNIDSIAGNKLDNPNPTDTVATKSITSINTLIDDTIEISTYINQIRTEYNKLLTFFSSKNFFFNANTYTSPIINFGDTKPTITFATSKGTATSNSTTFIAEDSTLESLQAKIQALNNDIVCSYSSSQLTITLKPINTTNPFKIVDTTYLGEAFRFLNTIGITGVTYSKSYTIPLTSKSFIVNVEPDLAAPAPPTVTADSSVPGIITITITYTPTSIAVKYIGLYIWKSTISSKLPTNATKKVLLPASSKGTNVYKFIYTPSLTITEQYNISAYTIGLYSQSNSADTHLIETTKLPQVWPPANVRNGIIRNGVATTANDYNPISPDFLANLLRYSIRFDTANSYTCTLIPSVDLIDICLRMNVDDRLILSITPIDGAPPLSTTYTGAPTTPSNPLVSIIGPQPGASNGGIFQYSQPFTLFANKKYTLSITYANLGYGGSVCGIQYVEPGAPGSSTAWTQAGPQQQNFYQCDALNILPAEDLSTYCFIPA